MALEPSSKIFMRMAQQIDKEMEAHTGNENQLQELRRVAGQCYFYAAINAIEEVLEKKGGTRSTIRNHKHRGALMIKQKAFFKNQEILAAYRKIIEERIRIEVGYKGKNGHKFSTLKKFAEICLKEL